MGNHLSCISPAAANRHPASENTIKLLDCATGAISQLEGPLTAAEAMMEFPAQFLCCFSSAMASGGRGRRICAVPADEDLQAAELYLLLPMHRLNTRFSVEEMTVFATLEAAQKSVIAGKQVFKDAILGSKVAPFAAPNSDALHSSIAVGAEVARSRSFKRLEETSLHEGPMRGGAGRHVMCRSKSWMPKLETVNECAVAS